MERVPKIVSERLQAATLTTAHPDADLLTAYSEHSLPERERERVLEHLAGCSQCREVVALALPAEDSAAVVLRPAPSAWLSWPRLRLGLVAAGIVAVASIGVLQYQRKARTENVARLYPASPTAPADEEAKTQAQVPAASPEPMKTEAKREDALAAASSPAAANTKKGDAPKEFDRLEQFAQLNGLQDKKATATGASESVFKQRGLAHGPKPPIQFQQNMNFAANAQNSQAFQNQTPASPPPAPNQQAANQLALTPPSSLGATMGGPVSENEKLDKLAIAGRSFAPLSGGSNAGAEVARAKPVQAANAPQAAPANGYTVSAETASNFSPSGALSPESARWSINATGGLQRSADQGRTWQDVDVNAGTRLASDISLQKAMKSSRDRALAKDKAEAKQVPVFRAVSANGPDVWAGASEGLLYHSSDSGAHWVRIVPSWRGVDLTGDIINLQFADPQRGRIITSSAEIWTTGDGGQTWDKH